MTIRKRSLPSGWYPAGREEVLARFNTWQKQKISEERRGTAAVVPHAGWSFSGELAYRTLSRIDVSVSTVVIIGGHLPSDGGVFAVFDEGFETPLGVIQNDKEFLEHIGRNVPLQEDIYADNTVEVQLPLVKYFFPEAEAVSLRVSPSNMAIKLGDSLFEAEKDLRKVIAVIGSTDLTHYGPNYGFTPRGTGKDAVRWVEEENDKKMIQAVTSVNPAEIITRGIEDRSACSAGAAAAAAQYASRSGIEQAELIDYLTSYSIHPADSFVGYAGILF